MRSQKWIEDKATKSSEGSKVSVWP